MSSQYVDLPIKGSTGGVSSLNSLTGALTLVAGAGISITPSGSNITITNTGATGTVTSVSVVSANGFAGTVATATTTPAITLSTTITGLLKGNGTAISAAVSGTDYQPAGNYITALTGDLTATGPGSVAATLATVNGNVGSFGSSTSIPSFTVNAKGLITAASGNVVIAPAGTLTGTTIASNVVNSSLTSVGSATSNLVITGGVRQTTRTTSSNLTIDTTTNDYIIFVDTSGGAVSLTLPTPTNGRILIIKDSTGSFGTNNCTMVRNGSEKIEGIATSKVLTTNWGSSTFTSNGTDWFMI